MREQQIATSNTIFWSHRLIIYLVLLGIAANIALAAYCHHWQQLLPNSHAHTHTQASTVQYTNHVDGDAGVVSHTHDSVTIPFGSELLQTLVSQSLLMLAAWTRILTDVPLLFSLAGGSVLGLASICLVPPEKPPRTSRLVLALA